ncbi:hypothetical protein BKA57DRAFT_307337 [Linnemannia elongata]|nr:hypothetical protein BKA57DRAFT_307337 [Linnemannia elongata]
MTQPWTPTDPSQTRNAPGQRTTPPVLVKKSPPSSWHLSNVPFFVLLFAEGKQFDSQRLHWTSIVGSLLFFRLRLNTTHNCQSPAYYVLSIYLSIKRKRETSITVMWFLVANEHTPLLPPPLLSNNHRFESLSLSSSNSNSGPTNRVDYDDGADSPSLPQRHPSVQRQVALSPQDSQAQRDQELVHSIALHSQNIQHQQLLHQQQQQEQQLRQLQSLPQRGRAMSSPIAPGRAVHGKSTGSRLVESNQNAAGLSSSSSSSSSSSASSSSRPLDQRTGRLQPLSQLSYSPLSPPMSPSPLPPSTTIDISMAMDEGTIDVLKKESIVQHSVAADSTNNASSQSKVLNLRQRKWNSVSKEWQEWHDVQATHAPDLPSPPSQQPQPQPQPPAINAISRTSAIEVAVLGRPTNVHTSSGTGAESVTDMQSRISSQQQITSGSLINHLHNNNEHQGKDGSLGRQRSLNESRDKFNGGHTQDDSKTSFGYRARSFSETNIYPYTQYQDYQHQQQQQQQQQQQGQQHQSHQRQQQFAHQQLIQLSTSSSYFPSQQWNNDVSGAADQLHPHPRHDPHVQQTVQDTGHLGHPPRHHSDHLYPHHGDAWVGHGSIDNASSRFGHSPRLRHSVSGSSSTARPQSPWMDLTMTALDGSVNAPNDRFLRHASNTNPTTGGGPSGSSSQGHGQRLEEMSSWNQHLHKTQSGYREALVITRHGGYGRLSPVQYGLHHLHHQHHSQEDVSMGEEAVRLMPSRSSSPSPCLSMAPTITRPLSISFSHLTGANMLADLAEHECDEDMEL